MQRVELDDRDADILCEELEGLISTYTSMRDMRHTTDNEKVMYQDRIRNLRAIQYKVESA